MFAVAHRTPLTADGCLAFAEAGATVFEMDVQVADDRVVVSHFLPMLRIRGWLENDHRRVRWRRHPSPDPVLEHVIALVPHQCQILLDLKEESRDRRAELIHRLQDIIAPNADRYFFSTRRTDDLTRLRAAGMRTWRTIDNPADLGRVLRGGPLPDEGVSIRRRLVNAESVRGLRERVGRIVVWTVNDPPTALTLAALGVDAITTDNPEVLTAIRSLGGRAG